MPRIRTIKPEFWTDEKVGKLKRDERLLFIGLWNIADDQGVIKANPAYIKGQLFSYDEELRIATVKQWLTSLAEARMLVPFSFNGESYYLVRTFEDHQLINRPSKPKFPEELIKSLAHGECLNTHGVLSEYSQQEGKGKVKEGNGTGDEDGNIDFSVFWELYDKKVGEKTKLEKKWASLPNKDRQQIIAYLPRYKAAQPDKKFRKNPETFLNNRSWEDELINGHSISEQPKNSFDFNAYLKDREEREARLAAKLGGTC